MVINRGKRSKTQNGEQPVENISKNIQSFQKISPVEKEVASSHELQDQTCQLVTKSFRIKGR